MKTLILAGVSLLAIAAARPATAADVPVPVFKAVPVVPFTWTGCYFGGHAGALWLDRQWSEATPGFATGRDYGGHEGVGWLGGLQTGCNYQYGALVVGVQGDYAWADANSSNVNPFIANRGDRTRIKSLATATARVGYAFGTVLGYVKGGVAWDRAAYDFYTISSGATFSVATEQQPGWTVGVGIEYAFNNNVTGFVEYDYYDFGTKPNTFVTVTSVFDRIVDIRSTAQVVKAGFNFKFDIYRPVIAKY